MLQRTDAAATLLYKPPPPTLPQHAPRVVERWRGGLAQAYPLSGPCGCPVTPAAPSPLPPLRLLPAGATPCRAGIIPAEEQRLFTAYGGKVPIGEGTRPPLPKSEEPMRWERASGSSLSEVRGLSPRDVEPESPLGEYFGVVQRARKLVAEGEVPDLSTIRMTEEIIDQVEATIQRSGVPFDHDLWRLHRRKIMGDYHQAVLASMQPRLDENIRAHQEAMRILAEGVEELRRSGALRRRPWWKRWLQAPIRWLRSRLRQA